MPGMNQNKLLVQLLILANRVCLQHQFLKWADLQTSCFSWDQEIQEILHRDDKSVGGTLGKSSGVNLFSYKNSVRDSN